MKNPELTTRDRILRAAIVRFSNNSYENTGLREIADDVRVDVSYVHRCFGSKQALFAEAVSEAVREADIHSVGGDTLGEHLAAIILEYRKNEGQSARALNMLVHSLSSREAASVLREAAAQAFVTPLNEKFPEITREQVALAVAILTGIGICRNVLNLDLFDDTDALTGDEILGQYISDIFQNMPLQK